MATTFSAAMERTPLRMFQIATFAICMLVLTCDGIDQQLLGIIAPKVIAARRSRRGRASTPTSQIQAELRK